ncbi:amidohydrolase family protein [Candidatus Xianfuyuplasma coldseepsis]|uniref:Amidohydrolase family protein n=1 Tax=Candidatus Xianfuyuplasma coldseepsis TaxID=2782163 RepID=A0A7L7KPD4_9MOLU|nr:amidohydrolase family protein [Xianfuyuplasma coldseepsis]QMS84405.1 amidohydrolase family protein [Xianfuyuplasma coldseepsis]
MIAIKNIQIYDFHHYIPSGFVVFDETIKAVGAMTDFSGDYDYIIDGEHQLLMPGFINGHNHIYSTFARGMTVPFNPTSFQELLEQLWWKLDRHLDLDAVYYCAMINGIEHVKHGTTTIIDHHASGTIQGSLDAINKALTQIGLRKILCFETSDRFDVDDCIKENQQYVDSQSATTAGLVGLHASLTLSDKTLQQIQETFPHQPIHIHVAESIEDQEHTLKHHQCRVVKRLDQFGLVREDSILAHGIYLSDDELDIIKKRKAVMAFNVTSNMNNGVGLPDYHLFKQRGIPVIIGNDGISTQITSEYQAVYYAMHHQSTSPIGFNFQDVIDMIDSTYQYASRRLGVSLGRVQPGYTADLQLIVYQPPTPMTTNNMFGHLFFGLFSNWNPSNVFINGQQVLRNRNLQMEEQDIYQQAQNAALRVWDKIAKEGKQ